MDTVPEIPWSLIALDAFTRPPEATGDSVRKDLHHILDRVRHKSEMGNPVIARSDFKGSSGVLADPGCAQARLEPTITSDP